MKTCIAVVLLFLTSTGVILQGCEKSNESASYDFCGEYEFGMASPSVLLERCHGEGIAVVGGILNLSKFASLSSPSDGEHAFIINSFHSTRNIGFKPICHGKRVYAYGRFKVLDGKEVIEDLELLDLTEDDIAGSCLLINSAKN